MARLIQFGPTIQVTEIDGTQLKVAEGVTWIARLSQARSGNRLNVFYFRDYLKAVDGVYGLETGIHEVEFMGDHGPHRIAFEVRGGALGWVSSVTLAKKATMNKIAQALASGLGTQDNGAITKEDKGC